MGDAVKSFLNCRQSMHKSFPCDYERKGKTCSAVRLFGKKKKSQLEIQLLSVSKVKGVDRPNTTHKLVIV